MLQLAPPPPPETRTVGSAETRAKAWAAFRAQEWRRCCYGARSHPSDSCWVTVTTPCATRRWGRCRSSSRATGSWRSHGTRPVHFHNGCRILHPLGTATMPSDSDMRTGRARSTGCAGTRLRHGCCSCGEPADPRALPVPSEECESGRGALPPLMTWSLVAVESELLMLLGYVKSLRSRTKRRKGRQEECALTSIPAGQTRAEGAVSSGCMF